MLRKSKKVLAKKNLKGRQVKMDRAKMAKVTGEKTQLHKIYLENLELRAYLVKQRGRNPRVSVKNVGQREIMKRVRPKLKAQVVIKNGRQ